MVIFELVVLLDEGFQFCDSTHQLGILIILLLESRPQTGILIVKLQHLFFQLYILLLVLLLESLCQAIQLKSFVLLLRVL